MIVLISQSALFSPCPSTETSILIQVIRPARPIFQTAYKRSCHLPADYYQSIKGCNIKWRANGPPLILIHGCSGSGYEGGLVWGSVCPPARMPHIGHPYNSKICPRFRSRIYTYLYKVPYIIQIVLKRHLLTFKT